MATAALMIFKIHRFVRFPIKWKVLLNCSQINCGQARTKDSQSQCLKKENHFQNAYFWFNRFFGKMTIVSMRLHKNWSKFGPFQFKNLIIQRVNKTQEAENVLIFAKNFRSLELTIFGHFLQCFAFFYPRMADKNN